MLAEIFALLLSPFGLFWNVGNAARSKQRSWHEHSEAATEVAKNPLRELREPASYAMLKTLLVSHEVIGVQVHDTRLVSVMQEHMVSPRLWLST